MKKRIIAFLVAVFMIPCTLISASASDDLSIVVNRTDPKVTTTPYASAYLDDYSISFGARDNCRMVVTMDVNAVKVVDRLGCVMLVIENKIDGTWYEYDTLYGMDHPDYYMYNTHSYLGSYSFYGEPGVQYRATMTALAQDSTGYDTGEPITSYVATCHE